MRNLFCLLLSISIFSCSHKRDFPAKRVCFLLYNLEQKKFVDSFNEARCHERLPAVSTFKIPLAVMAYDSKVLTDEKKPLFKWQGEKTLIESWNQDQTPQSWMRNSAVWVSQEITALLGESKIASYLTNFKYGNADMSGGLKYAWLTPAPFIKDPMQNSLRLSAYEQITFLEKLWHTELKASSMSQELTKKLLTEDVSPRGFILSGKTGSGFTDENHDQRLGWFVGHLAKREEEYLVVVNFSDKQKVPAGTFGGRDAKELAIKFLSEKGLW